MPSTKSSTPGIILRRVDYGDYDLILTLLSRSQGKISLIAKSAKKSVKRFAGILEPFSILNISYSHSRGRGLMVLQEAALTHPLSNLRADIQKTAYASYWSETLHLWMMEGKKEVELYDLLHYSLTALDATKTLDALLSLMFQIKFLSLSGLAPNMESCMRCHQLIDDIPSSHFAFDAQNGGLICQGCVPALPRDQSLSKGTIKLLAWLTRSPFSHVDRLRYSPPSLEEGQRFLEILIPSQLGKKPKSLSFIQSMRPFR